MSEWMTSVAALAGVDASSPAAVSAVNGMNGGGFRKSFASQYQRGGRGGVSALGSSRSQHFVVPNITEVSSDDEEEGDERSGAHCSSHLTAGFRLSSEATSPTVESAQGSVRSVTGPKHQRSDGAITPPPTGSGSHQPVRSSSMYSRSVPSSGTSRSFSGLPLGPLIYRPATTTLQQPQQQQQEQEHHVDPSQNLRRTTSPINEGIGARSGSGSNHSPQIPHRDAVGQFAENRSDDPLRAGGHGIARSGSFYSYSRVHVPPLSLTSGPTSNTNGSLVVGPLQLQHFGAQQQRSNQPGSARSSLQSSAHRSGSSRPPQRRPCPNILVLGSRQVGKSSFVNAFRAVNTASAKWPVAPVGMCGRHGTTAVDPCPNNSMNPSWILVDTPGRVYSELHRRRPSSSPLCHTSSDTTPQRNFSPATGDPAETDTVCSPKTGGNFQLTLPTVDGGSHHAENYDGDDSLLLQLLFEGLPWKTRLVGPKSATVAALSELPPSPANRAHHAVVVLSATDIVTAAAGRGIGSWLGLTVPKFVPAPQLESLRSHLADFLEYVRVLLGDRAPFIVVSHMDSFPPASRGKAEERIKQELKYCVPLNRVYFLTLPSSSTSTPVSGHGKAPVSIVQQMESIAPREGSTKSQLLKLHHDLQADLSWFYTSSGPPPESASVEGEEQPLGDQRRSQSTNSGYLR